MTGSPNTGDVTVAVINRSSLWTDAEAKACVAALQIQLDRDFAPAWNLSADLHFVGATEAPPAGTWWLTLLDNTDDATALGYHEMTSDGLPIGKAFLRTAAVDGGIPSVVVSHELLEMLRDPWIADLVLDNNHTRTQRLYAVEVCDACEADAYAYDINGVSVSDFVYPAWFEGWRTPTPSGGKPVQYDYRREIAGPFVLLPGGYISFMNVVGGGWQQATADLRHQAQYRAHVGSRRERRYLGKNFWRPSTAHATP